MNVCRSKIKFIFKTDLFFCNYIVSRTRALFIRTQLLTYYRTHVKPIVQYGVPVHGCTAYSNLHEIFKVQKRIIQSICFLSKYANVTDYVTENELPTAYELHIFELFEFVLTCIREEHSRKSLNELLTPQNCIYCLRSVARLESSGPCGNTKKLNHSLAKRIPNLCNNLSRNGILVDNSAQKSYSLYQIIQYRHNISF